VLLQILDDGRVTDSHGHVINFKNTIIIMTSNIGSNHIIENADGNYEDIKKTVLSELSHFFKPEFLNRVDELVVFHALTLEDILRIVDIQLARFADILASRRISFSFDDKARRLLATDGFDPLYGARPLKRTIQKLIETPLSRMIVAGEVNDGDNVKISADNNEIKFKVANPAKPDK
jgi:ATP-dependent Clp protease ATP-binding subunit ClpB